ncbi:nose resistant to fluoxetine protein 6-like [Amphiura filiformis]|uniref:nose resistant to fluoxetine protein 6-like n=1 Tax=Amphiura filiformis TaxID=82378 RepID=UPI003B222148
MVWASWGDVTAWFKALFTGNAKSPGAYELCTGLTKEDDALPFDVQYCMMQSQAIGFVLIFSAVGSCWPASCSAEDLTTAHKTYLGVGEDADTGADIAYDCFEDVPWSGGAIATLCVLSFFALIVLIGTVYHVTSHDHVTSVLEELKRGKFKAQTTENSYEQTVHDEALTGAKTEYESAFSTDATTEKCIGAGESDIRSPLDDQPPAYEEPKTSADANGTMSNGTTKLVIEEDSHGNRKVEGHKLDNPVYLFDVNEKTAFLAVNNATFSVDTFFLLSGFLVTYLTLKELKKTSGRVNWFLFYFHRFWRITPLYMVCLAIWATLSPYLGKGGAKDDFYDGANYWCEKYWWTNLLYISNLYPFPGNINEQCMGWSWYLSNDMQFYIISPFIVYCLYKSRKWGVSLLALLCGVSFGSTAYVCWYWGLPAYGSNNGYYNNRTTTTPGIDQTDDFIYGKPYVRIQTYLVGMMLGYIIYKMNGKPYKLNKFLNILGWAVSAALACTVIYGLGAANAGPQTPQWLAICYNCLSRFTYAIAVSWVMFACITGNGGYINSFLSWNFWSPLAKLNFAAYLVHPIIIYQVILTKKALLHFTYVEMSYWFIANMVASYACAYILSLLVEGPTVGIEKAFLGRPSRDSRDKKERDVSSKD